MLSAHPDFSTVTAGQIFDGMHWLDEQYEF